MSAHVTLLKFDVTWEWCNLQVCSSASMHGVYVIVLCWNYTCVQFPDIQVLTPTWMVSQIFSYQPTILSRSSLIQTTPHSNVQVHSTTGHMHPCSNAWIHALFWVSTLNTLSASKLFQRCGVAFGRRVSIIQNVHSNDHWISNQNQKRQSKLLTKVQLPLSSQFRDFLACLDGCEMLMIKWSLLDSQHWWRIGDCSVDLSFYFPPIVCCQYISYMQGIFLLCWGLTRHTWWNLNTRKLPAFSRQEQYDGWLTINTASTSLIQLTIEPHAGNAVHNCTWICAGQVQFFSGWWQRATDHSHHSSGWPTHHHQGTQRQDRQKDIRPASSVWREAATSVWLHAIMAPDKVCPRPWGWLLHAISPARCLPHDHHRQRAKSRTCLHCHHQALHRQKDQHPCHSQQLSGRDEDQDRGTPRWISTGRLNFWVVGGMQHTFILSLFWAIMVT